VAAQLGVSRTWLYDAAKTGRIPSIRIGGPDGPLRFIPEDLQRWIDDARAERPPLIFPEGTHAQARGRRETYAEASGTRRECHRPGSPDLSSM
jgi:predicted DNA-binding transcriptional regulator AlpA